MRHIPSMCITFLEKQVSNLTVLHLKLHYISMLPYLILIMREHMEWSHVYNMFTLYNGKYLVFTFSICAVWMARKIQNEWLIYFNFSLQLKIN